MRTFRAFAVLPIVVAFMALVDKALFELSAHDVIPGWIPVALIVFQALYVTVMYGFLLMSVGMPRPESEVE